MRPLTANKLQEFLERFENFEGSEFRSLRVLSANSMCAVFALQDKARAFDWITLELEFSGVSDAQLLDESKLAFVDLSTGVSMVNENGVFGFCVGSYNNLASFKNSPCYIISSSVKYLEGTF